MIIPNTAVRPYSRQNKRRERPGSRKRRTLAQTSLTYNNVKEGIADSHNSTIHLPPESSLMLQQTFDEYRVPCEALARTAEEKVCDGEEKAITKAWADMDVMQKQKEQLRMFGGEGFDDDASLIEPMKRVLFDLFGDIDFGYP
ncbi:hypothetical protein B0O99DRAFT_682583 [Bisporella sp. PMI_857]|nr:hypothetical protein B0O99DRAFT_682583 [Bisporella sp. PMI_857]